MIADANLAIQNTSFYVAGGTLLPDAPSYVPRQADFDLLDGLLQGQFCYVLNARQMGKSSLMVRTKDRLIAKGITVAVLDLTELGQNLTLEQWYYGLLRRLGDQIGLLDPLVAFWRQNKEMGPLQRWMAAIRQVCLAGTDGRLVIFVDEIDAVRSLPFSTDEFFAGIRECYNRRVEDQAFERLTFCLLGVATPADLIRDVRTTPFNIGRRIELTDFTETEAEPLTEGLSGGGRNGAELLARVLFWTGGHPYLTQRLCQAVAEDASAKTLTGVDRICETIFLSQAAREADDNLAFVRNRILKSEVDLADILDLYKQVCSVRRVRDDVTNLLISILRLSGIVRVVKGYLRVRNRIYARVFDREWVRTNMPDAELRRQRAAFRRGLLRAAAISLAIIGAMGALVLRTMQSENAARAVSDRSKRLLYIANMNMAQEEWDNNNIRRVLDLLNETRSDPARGFEWGFWQRLCRLNPVTFNGHTDEVTSVAYSPDGRRMVTGSADGTAKVWDAATDRPLFTLHGSVKGISSVAFSPNGKLIAAGCYDNMARVWDTSSGRRIRSLQGHTWPVTSIAFMPDGKHIVTGSADKTARIWDVATGQAVRILKGHTNVINSVAVSPDGRRIATGSYDQAAKLWDAETGHVILTLPLSSQQTAWTVTSIAFSPDGKRLVRGCADGIAILSDAATGRDLLTLRGHAGRVTSVAFSPDGRSLVTGNGDGTAIVWDANGREQLILTGHTNRVNSVAFSPDGRHILTGSADTTTKVWGAAKQSQFTSLFEHDSEFTSVAYSPDGRRIVTGNADGVAIVWDVATQRKLLTLRGHKGRISSVAYSPDGRYIATGSDDKTAKIWDAVTGRVIIVLIETKDYSRPASLPWDEGWIASVAFSPDSKHIVTGSDPLITGGSGNVKIWDITNGSSIELKDDNPPDSVSDVTIHSHAVFSVAFSRNGKRFAAGGADGTVKVWSAASRHVIARFKGVFEPVLAVAFSPDSKWIAIGSGDSMAKLWNVETGALINLKGHTDPVTAVAFSPDGKRLVTGSSDFTAKIWDVISGRETLTLSSHTAPVTSVAFAPDDQSIVTGSRDHTAKLWQAAPWQNSQVPDDREHAQ